jgi:SAM-dependent methyltransferase
MSYLQITDPARSAYAALAPYYDRFIPEDHYDRWLGQIEARALGLGLTGRRALDIGCGTGRSFVPLLARGYEVCACDLSPEMVDEARAKHAFAVEDLFVADMRALPEIGTFDLVTCLDDAINYLLSESELRDTFRGVSRLLAPGGIFAFDVNSLKTYRTTFTQTFVREDAGALFCWRGEATSPIDPGDAASASIEAFIEGEDALWQRVTSRHVQRHHPPELVRATLEAAGLECSMVAGQLGGGHLEDRADETEHIKLVYLARHPGRRGERG